MARRERLCARARRARGLIYDRAEEAARRRRRPLPHPGDREGARRRGDRDRAQARRRARQRLRRRRERRRRGRAARRSLALLDRPALPRERLPLRRSAAGAVLVQLGLRRVRDVPRLRPRDRRRPRPRHPRPQEDASQRRDQDDPDAGVEGVPGRPDEVRRRGRHPARYRVVAADGSAAALGHRRLAELERQVEPAVVRRAPLLRVPGVEGVQDAHPRALVEVPQLHAVPRVRRRAAEARGAALAPRHQGRRRRRDGSRRALHAGRRRLVARAARGAARAHRARPDDAADRAHPPLLRRALAADEPARRSAEAPPRRGPDAVALPLRRRHRLTSRSIARAGRSRAARCSASTSRPRSARRSSTRCSSSTSRRSACTRATWAGSSRRCTACATPATRSSSSSTTPP